MDYAIPHDLPIERDPYATPDQHFTYSAGLSRAAINGAVYQELRRENQHRHDHAAALGHWPMSRTS